MRKRFRRQMNLPSFKDPAALRRENIARAGLHPTPSGMRRERWLVEWPEVPHAALPALPRLAMGLGPWREPDVDMLADVIHAARRARSYDEALAAAILIARERRMRRAFGPPYEEYEDDPILR